MGFLRTGFIILILISLLLRIKLILSPAFKLDINVIKFWTERITSTPFNLFYDPNIFIDYPPFFFYFLFIVGKIYEIFFASSQINSLTFEVFYKSVLVIFDFASAYIIYKIIHKYSDQKTSLLGSLVYLFNPVILFDIALWGQNDGVLIFLLLLSSYLLFEKRQLKTSVIIFTLALLFKFQAAAALPVIGLFLLKSFPIKKVLVASLVGLFSIIIVTFPFFESILPLKQLFIMAQNSSSVYPYTSLNAFNVWAFDGFWKSDTRTFLFINFQTLGVIIFIIFLVSIILKLSIQRKISTLNYYFGISLSFFAFFLFLTRMHERYIIPFFAFFIFVVILSKRHLATYILLIFISFLNLFYVYYYYNVIYNNSISNNNLIYQFVDNSYIWLSLINILIFVYLLMRFLTLKKDA